MTRAFSRREFLATAAPLLLVGCHSLIPGGNETEAEPITDIHQHTHYHARSDHDLLAHQRAMGVTRTILLPAGSMYGLDAEVTGNEAAFAFTSRHPREFRFFANEVAGLPQTRSAIRHWLRKGAIGIGEQKFHVDVDSREFAEIAELAAAFDVPVLMHFQHGVYNRHIERFPKVLERFPRVQFIGHAQTWWSNIDAHCDQKTLYPKGPVTPGGWIDLWLKEYPNLFGDLSADSGLNALTRDKEFTRGFFHRHQDKLLFGSDCEDALGYGPTCTGARIIAAVKELAPDKSTERKLLHENARKLFSI